jgi:hypothetical protein
MLRFFPVLLCAVPLAADPAPEPKRVPDAAAFPKAFAAVLGDHFEYLGGEPGRTKGNAGSWAAERFWYAKVRARIPGKFVLTYRIRFEFPARLAAPDLMSPAAEYTFRIAVGEAETPRLFHPHPGVYGGAVYPHANVGDTLLIPVHADPFRVDHRFDPVRRVADDDPLFRVLGERTDAYFLKRDAGRPVVRNDAADRLELRAAWGGAYLEFTAADTFNLVGRLAGMEPVGPGVPFRVRPRDRPVTTLLEVAGYVESAGGSRLHGDSWARRGTLEARVGDRVVVDSAAFAAPHRLPPGAEIVPVVDFLPFRDVPHYAPR